MLLGNPCTESGSEKQLSSIIHMLVGMKDKGIATDGNSNSMAKRQTSAELERFSTTINHNCDGMSFENYVAIIMTIIKCTRYRGDIS